MLFVVAPVGISFLNDDLSFYHDTLQQKLDVEALVRIPRTKGVVVESDVECEIGLLDLGDARISFSEG